jgi:PAS domain S-box-containing protein
MRMLGHRDKSEVIGEEWSKKIAGEGQKDVLKERYDELLVKGSISAVTTRVRKHDGSSFPIEVSAALIKDASGISRGIITVSRDVSDREFLSESIRKRDRIMHAISSSIYTLFDSDDPGYCMVKMLELIGEAADVSRSYIWTISRSGDGEITASLVDGWTREGIYPRIEDLRKKPLDIEGFDRWIGTLSSEGIIHGPVSTFPDPERRKLDALSIRSILVVPIIHRNAWIGIMGLDDCGSDKVWSQQEIGVLRIGAKIASHILTRGSAIPPHPLVAGHPIERGDRAPE